MGEANAVGALGAGLNWAARFWAGTMGSPCRLLILRLSPSGSGRSAAARAASLAESSLASDMANET